MKRFIGCCLLLLALQSFSQAPAEMLEAMRQLDFLEGVWKGKGWIQLGDKKQFFNETETASLKAGGTLLQIDVFGTSVDNDSVIINNGLALARYNLSGRKYEILFYQSDGSLAQATLSVKDKNTAEIILHRGTAYTRFVIEAKNKQWLEQGFTSTDGKNWKQFFEMKLNGQ